MKYAPLLYLTISIALYIAGLGFAYHFTCMVRYYEGDQPLTAKGIFRIFLWPVSGLKLFFQYPFFALMKKLKPHTTVMPELTREQLNRLLRDVLGENVEILEIDHKDEDGTEKRVVH